VSLSPQWLDELRGRIALSGVISRTTRLTKAGREFKACCPFHNEKTPSFTVNDDKGFYHCFGCGAHGDVIRWMTDQRGLAFMDAVKELAAEAGMELPALDPRAREREDKRQGLDDVMTAAQAWFVDRLRSDEGAAARRYLASREFAPLVVERFGFGYAPEGRQALKAALSQFPEAMLQEAGLRIAVEERDPYDRFRGRLMLPIRNPRGGIVGFGGRILDKTAGDAPKYLNSPDTPIFDKGRTLYNLDKAGPLARKSGRLVVVEGYMDVVALANAGIEEGVAPLGTALTEAQLELAWRVAETPVLCFDGDAAGQRAAMRAMIRALPLLQPAHSLAIVRLPQGLDPDDLLKARGAAAMLDLLGQATPLVEALWEAERDAEPVATPEAKAGLKARLVAHVDTIQNPDIRALYRRELLDRFAAWAYPPRERATFRPDIQRRERSDPQATRRLDTASRSAGDRLLAAVLAGSIRFPAALAAHVDTLSRLRPADRRMSAILDVLLECSEAGAPLEALEVATILQSRGLSPPTPSDYANFRYPFLAKAVDPAEGMRMLTEAIALLVSRPALDSAMAGTADRFELDPEGAIAEQERLRKTKLASQDKLMQRASARAAAPETETNETHGD